MPRRASRSAPPDSLDLLLDTMCNAFGGIVIIAILVALMINNEGSSRTSKDAPEELARIEEELSRVREAIQGINISSRLKMLELSHLKAVGVEDAVEKAEQATVALRSAQMEEKRLETEKRILSSTDLQKGNQELKTELSERREKQSELAAKAKELESRIAETAAKVASLREEAGRMKGASKKEIKRPGREILTDLSPFNLMFMYDRVYPIDLFDSATGIYTTNQRDIRWRGGADPVPGRGFNLDDADDLKRLAKMIDAASRGSLKIEIQCQVYEDSFVAFEAYREMVHSKLSKPLRIGWHPLLTGQRMSYGADGHKDGSQ